MKKAKSKGPALAHTALYASLKQCEQKDILFHKEYVYQFNLEIRAFCIQTDMPFIYAWIAEEYSSEPRLQATELQEELLQTYSYIQQSNYIRSFMGLQDNEPGWLVDIYQAAQDKLYNFYPVLPGDYIIRVLADPKKKFFRQLYCDFLKISVDFFSKHTDTKRIILETDAENYPDSTLLEQAGFRFLQHINQAHYTSTLYACTPEQH